MTKPCTEMVKILEGIGFNYLYQSDRCNGLIPPECGVYCFTSLDYINNQAELIYIGKSSNFSSRLKPWHRIENLVNETLLCYIKFCDDYDELEIELIKKFAPKYNIQHNPKIRRRIIYE